MSVAWILNDSKYEISSKEHLLQLMNDGTLYSDTGSPPTDYWSSDYIQTIDIYLEADDRIKPIGSSSEPFSGSYDGNNYGITDYTYKNASESNVGLFGYVSEALLQNFSLEGTWIIESAGQSAFLVGAAVSSSGIYNISLDASGGYIDSSGSNVGALIGSAADSTLEGLTVNGVLSHISAVNYAGGIAGSITGSTLNFTRSMVRFSDSPAISGSHSAGVCASIVNSSSSYVMNAIVGSIEGVDHAGGLFAVVENTPSEGVAHLVNAMTGTISTTGVIGSSGGIASSIIGTGGNFIIENVANYMSGDVSAPVESGGISGSISSVSILNSVVAMNGTVQYAGVQTSTGAENAIEAQIITAFGLTHTDSGTTTELTGLSGPFEANPGFDALEYFPLQGVDTRGNNYNFEFVFACVSGSVDYSAYTHVVISPSDVSGPIEVQVNLPDSLVEYVYYMNISSNEVTTSPGVPVTYSSGTVFDTAGSTLYPIPPLVITVTSPFSVNISWEDIPGSTSYRVDFGSTSSSTLERSVVTDTSFVDVFNLDASVEYEFQLHSSLDGSTFTLEDDVSSSVTMPSSNSSGSYILSTFLDDNKYDLSSFSPEKSSHIASIIGELLGQDESILMRVDGQTRELLVSGVSGSTLDIQEGDEYILPFQPSSGAGQSLTLEGIHEGSLEYNESTDSVTIEGQEYFPGDSVVVGDVRITLRSV